MKWLEFVASMDRATENAQRSCGLDVTDLTLILTTERAWHDAGCPTTGILAKARKRARNIFQLDTTRETRERLTRTAEIHRLEHEVVEIERHRRSLSPVTASEQAWLDDASEDRAEKCTTSGQRPRRPRMSKDIGGPLARVRTTRYAERLGR